MSPRPRKVDPRFHGVLLVDKPSGHTSHDVVARVRRAAGFVRCGHAGTLDPMATGVLPVLLGEATRISDHLLLKDKEYVFTMRLGMATDTQDATGQVVRTGEVPPLDATGIGLVLERFTGTVSQLPPMYSAVRIDGQRLYQAARRGIEVPRPPREVRIERLELVSMDLPDLTLRVHCSKGTYVRQLAEDLGQAWNCPAHVTELRRVASGFFRAEDAWPLDELLSLSPEDLSLRLVSMADALRGLSRVRVPGDLVGALACGQSIVSPEKALVAPVVLLSGEGRVLALAEIEGEKLRPVRVFPGSFEKTTCILQDFHQNPSSGG